MGAETAEEVKPAESQQEVETQKVFDMQKGEFVEVPVEKKAEKKEEVKVDEEEEEKEEETTETEEKEEEQEEEQEEEEKEEFDSVTPDDFIKAQFEEKYDVKSQQELEELIDSASDVMKEYEALKKQVSELKDSKPKFASQEEEKAFEFIKKFGVPRQGEAFQTYAKLVAMDVDNTDPRMLLEERYVHENPELTREEAQKRFARDYNRKYNLTRENFDGSDQEFKEEQEMLEIDKKSEVAKAKKFLKEQQEKFKPTVKDEAPKVPEVVGRSIEKNTSNYQSYMEDLNEIVFEESGEKINFKLDKEKKAAMSKGMMAWVKNPASYDEKGKLIGVDNPEDMSTQLAGAMFMQDIIKTIVSQVKNSVNIKRVEEVAGKAPDKRKSVGEGKVIKGDDLYAAAAELVKKKKANA